MKELTTHEEAQIISAIMQGNLRDLPEPLLDYLRENPEKRRELTQRVAQIESFGRPRNPELAEHLRLLMYLAALALLLFGLSE